MADKHYCLWNVPAPKRSLKIPDDVLKSPT